MSRATVLGDAIIAYLNGHEFSKAFVAERKYIDTSNLKDIKGLNVILLTPRVSQDVISRIGNVDMIYISILVWDHVDGKDNAKVDPLVDLTEEIADHFRDNDLGGGKWESTEVLNNYDLDSMMGSGMFASAIQLVYRVVWKNA